MTNQTLHPDDFNRGASADLSASLLRPVKLSLPFFVLALSVAVSLHLPLSLIALTFVIAEAAMLCVWGLVTRTTALHGRAKHYHFVLASFFLLSQLPLLQVALSSTKMYFARHPWYPLGLLLGVAVVVVARAVAYRHKLRRALRTMIDTGRLNEHAAEWNLDIPIYYQNPAAEARQRVALTRFAVPGAVVGGSILTLLDSQFHFVTARSVALYGPYLLILFMLVSTAGSEYGIWLFLKNWEEANHKVLSLRQSKVPAD